MKNNTLTDTIRERILREWVTSRPAGTRISAEKDLAEQYNVSMTTIRRAVDQLTQSRHLERRHGSGTFVLRPNGVRRVGIMVPENQYTNFFAQLACRLEKALRQRGYDNSLFTASGAEYDMDEVGKHVTELDALLICGYSVQLPELQKLGIPYLFVGNEEAEEAPAIGGNLAGAIQKLVAHLREQGCREFRFITHYDTREKLEMSMRYYAFRKALYRNGLPFRPDMITASGKTFSCWGQHLDQMLEAGPFDALICSQDEIALSLMPQLRARNLRIPEDVCVAGCNNLLPPERHPIPLTTIDFRMDLLVRETVRFLDDQIFCREPEIENINVTLPLDLIVRASSDRRKIN